jgi:twitching motility protein PilI
MNGKSAGIPRPWLNPSAALSRFKPPRGVATGIKTVGRERVRYGFRVGSIGMLIDQDTVSEIMEQIPIYPLPNTPPWMLGLVNLRGNLAPVFDLKQVLELEDGRQDGRPWERRLLILDRGDKAVGILIDGLPQTAVTSHALSRLPPLPPVLQTHVAKAYAQADLVWLEFDHQSFFRSLSRRMAGTD